MGLFCGCSMHYFLSLSLLLGLVLLSVCVYSNDTPKEGKKPIEESQHVLWLFPEQYKTRIALIFGEKNATVFAMPISMLSADSEYEITISYSSVTPASLSGEFLNRLSDEGIERKASRTSDSNQIRFTPSNYEPDVTITLDGVPTECIAIRVVSNMLGVLHPDLYYAGHIPRYVPVDVVLSEVRFGLPQRALPVMGTAALLFVLTCIVTPIIVNHFWIPDTSSKQSKKPSLNHKPKKD